MPVGEFTTFDECVAKTAPKKNPKTGKAYGQNTARKICGKMQAQSHKKGK